MSNEKHYNYYSVTPFESKEVHALYNSTIKDKRKAAQQKLMDETGCIAWTESSNWGGAAAQIDCLVYPADSELVREGYIKVTDRRRYEGKKAVVLRGKMNRKKGNEFNLAMNRANEALSDLPDFPDWLVHVHYKVSRTGLGGPGPRGHGTAMLQTSGGTTGGGRLQLVFRIPNEKGVGEIPASFHKMTYGQWYDLVEGGGK